MYHVWISGLLMPVTPEKISIKVNGQNKTYNLINETEILVLKAAKLTDITFDVLLPSTHYHFAKYKHGFTPPNVFLKHFELMKRRKRPFHFVVTRQMPNGKMLFDTNIKCSLQDYETTESAQNGFDIMVSLKLKQFKDYGTKTCKIKGKKGKQKIVVVPPKPAKLMGQNILTTYVVKKNGETLLSVALKHFGDETLYGELYTINTGAFKDPGNLKKGTKLKIPRY